MPCEECSGSRLRPRIGEAAVMKYKYNTPRRACHDNSCVRDEKKEFGNSFLAYNAPARA